MAVGVCGLFAIAQPAGAQGTAFTYQGRLEHAGSAADGLYDVSFGLFNSPAGGPPVAALLTNTSILISNGLFTTTLDFGPGVFPGGDRWLELSIRTNGAAAFTTLAPRQWLGPTPYAITAENLSGPLSAGGLSGVYSNAVVLGNSLNQISGAFSGNGAGLSGVNASALGGLAPGGIWQTLGNSGTTPGVNFLGTQDNQPLELWVNNGRSLRVEPVTTAGGKGTPNLIGGGSGNTVVSGVQGAVIAGGGAAGGSATTRPNGIGGDFSAVGGGEFNLIGATDHSVIAGGYQNLIQDGASVSSLGGGEGNAIQAGSFGSTLGGGVINTIQPGAHHAVLGGGFNNSVQAGAYFSTLSGGNANSIGTNAQFATVAGGQFNAIQTNGSFAFVGGGYSNQVRSSAQYSAIAGGQYNSLGAGAIQAFIGAGYDNTIQAGAYQSVIGGGRYNQAGASDTVIGGGTGNSIGVGATESVVAGGGGNTIGANANDTVIGGGSGNRVDSSANLSVIAGGQSNEIQDKTIGGAVLGGVQNFIQSGANFAAVGGGNNNLIRSNAVGSAIFGGQSNLIIPASGFIGGGSGNVIQTSSDSSVIAGGLQNAIRTNCPGSAIGGGFQNIIRGSSQSSTIGGGQDNVIESDGVNVGGDTICGGTGNAIVDQSAGNTITGGEGNGISGSTQYSAICGGLDNAITNSLAGAILGGASCLVGATGAIAAGDGAYAVHPNSFVWADNPTGFWDSYAPFLSIHTNEFAVRATGGVRFVTGVGAPNQYAPTAGVKLNPAATSWSTISDRNVKKDIAPADCQAVLEKLAEVPVSTWRYQWEPESETPNFGPMAQDFKAAFYPGRDDRSITTLEFDGIELAAIQGLDQKLKAKDAEIQNLNHRLRELEAAVKSLLEAKESAPTGPQVSGRR